MAKEKEDCALKLIHLLWVIIGTVLAAGVTWGITINQQKNNTAAIETKVGKDIFEMHLDQQKEQYQSMDKKLDLIIENK